jgi:hypothetical protein
MAIELARPYARGLKPGRGWPLDRGAGYLPDMALGQPGAADFPVVVLSAAILAAERVSFILVGSAALWLRGEEVTVGDTDVVIGPGEANLQRLHDCLKTLATNPSALPSPRRLTMQSIVPVQTSFGKLDLLLERGRQDWDGLRPGADLIDVTDVGVLVASAADCHALRRLYKRR